MPIQALAAQHANFDLDQTIHHLERLNSYGVTFHSYTEAHPAHAGPYTAPPALLEAD